MNCYRTCNTYMKKLIYRAFKLQAIFNVKTVYLVKMIVKVRKIYCEKLRQFTARRLIKSNSIISFDSLYS